MEEARPAACVVGKMPAGVFAIVDVICLVAGAWAHPHRAFQHVKKRRAIALSLIHI